MLKYFTITISIILLAGLILPQACLAGNIPFEGPLVPCGTDEDPEKCNLCHLFELAQNIIDLFLTLIIFIAPLMIVIGGVVLLTAGGVPERVSTGKRIITYVVIGIVISFTAWAVINTIMNKLIDPDVRPWPWNDPDCAPSEGNGNGETHLGCVDQQCQEVSGAGEDECSTDQDCIQEGDICRCEWDSGEVTTKTYSDSEECESSCESRCSTPIGPTVNLSNFCCVESEDEECAGEDFGTDDVWCVCETPVYTVDPNQYPEMTKVLGTEIEGTELSSAEECSQNCNSDNAATYCSQRTLTDEAAEGTFYCASENDLEGKQTYCMEIEGMGLEIVGDDTESCSSQLDVCVARSNPETSIARKEFVDACWFDGIYWCTCEESDDIYCTSSRPYGLFRNQQEHEVGSGSMSDAYRCVKYCGGYGGGDRCRLGSFYEEEEEAAEWRFQGDLEGTKDQQIADTTTSLSNLLDCFYENAPEDIGYIAAITDIDIYKDRGLGLCDPNDCKQSNCEQDQLCGEGKACDHSCNSCHYGGTCITTNSYAVDFGDQENACEIAETALQCSGVNKIYGPQSCGGDITVDGDHDDHVHISVINSCNCN